MSLTYAEAPGIVTPIFNIAELVAGRLLETGSLLQIYIYFQIYLGNSTGISGIYSQISRRNASGILRVTPRVTPIQLYVATFKNFSRNHSRNSSEDSFSYSPRNSFRYVFSNFPREFILLEVLENFNATTSSDFNRDNSEILTRKYPKR